MGLGLDRRRGGVGWIAAGRWWARATMWGLLGTVGFAIAAGLAVACAWGFAWGGSAWAQSETDGGIGGRVLSAEGRPVGGAVVTARDLETGLALRARTGAHGEFLVVRLPVGEYEVTVEDAGVEVTLAEPVSVGLGEVTEVEARMAATDAGTQAGLPDAPGVSGGAASGTGAEVSATDVAELPARGGDWRSLALTVPGANGAADGDESAGEASYRGVDVTENSGRVDGTSADEGFSGLRAGTGVEEEVDAGSDAVLDRSSGVGSAASSVADGGQRAGSAYAFSQAGVREFRVMGQGNAAAYGSALYGHGVGGVVTTVSRSGGTKLHGMGFYTVRDSAWAAANPFDVASSY
jgi:hypothetical protein